MTTRKQNRGQTAKRIKDPNLTDRPRVQDHLCRDFIKGNEKYNFILFYFI